MADYDLTTGLVGGGVGAGGGAMAGAAIGAAGGPIGMLGGALIGGASGLLGGFLGGGDEGPGYAVIDHAKYPWTEPALEQAMNFQTSNLAAIGRGEFPSWYQNAIPAIRGELESPLMRRVFGTQGDRTQSTLGVAQAAGSLGGLGPRALTQNVNKQLTDYQERSQSIDRFIAQQGADITSKFAQSIPNYIGAAPRGPEQSIVGLPATSNSNAALLGALGTAAGSFLGNYDWGGGKTTTTPGTQGNIMNSFNLGGSDFGLGSDPIVPSDFGRVKQTQPSLFQPVALSGALSQYGGL